MIKQLVSDPINVCVMIQLLHFAKLWTEFMLEKQLVVNSSG